MNGINRRMLLDEVMANQKLLEECKDHHFRPITPGLFGTRYKCYACKGEVDGLSAKWYERGRIHGAVLGPIQPSGTPG